MIRRPPRSTLDRSSAASDVYKRQVLALGVRLRLLVELAARARHRRHAVLVELPVHQLRAELAGVVVVLRHADVARVRALHDDALLAEPPLELLPRAAAVRRVAAV